MKVAIITPYKNYYGGVENFNKKIENILINLGYEIQYITLDGDECKGNIILKKIFGQPYITARKFRRCKTKFDLVICNGEFGFGIRHKKCINIFHGSYYGVLMNSMDNTSIKDKLHLYRLSFIQKISAKNKYVVSVSEYLKDILNESGIQVDKVINNSIDLSKFYPNREIDKRKGCIFVGSYNYFLKGFDILKDLAVRGIDITCITNKKVDSPLKYVKNIENDLMNEVYNKYKILVFPSRFESFGYVALEALAAGVPIIMNNIGIGKEIMKLEPNFIVDIKLENLADVYLQKIEMINDNYAYYCKIARKIAENHFSYDMFESEWVKVLEDIYEVKL